MCSLENWGEIIHPQSRFYRHTFPCWVGNHQLSPFATNFNGPICNIDHLYRTPFLRSSLVPAFGENYPLGIVHNIFLRGGSVSHPLPKRRTSIISTFDLFAGRWIALENVKGATIGMLVGGRITVIMQWCTLLRTNISLTSRHF